MNTKNNKNKQRLAKLYSEDHKTTDDIAQHIHLGYWRDGVEDIETAYDIYLRKLLANGRVAIKRGDRILDLGCGNGAVSIWLVQNFDCRVYAIDIVEINVDRARNAVKALGLEEKITVECLDCADMDLPENSFEHVIAVESLYHVKNQAEVYKKIFKILKPGGSLIFSNCALKKQCGRLSAKIAQLLTGCGHRLEYMDFYSQALTSCGLNVTGIKDASHRTLIPTYSWVFSNRYELAEQFFLKRFVFLKRFRSITNLLSSAFKMLIFRGISRNHWGMVFLAADKPGIKSPDLS